MTTKREIRELSTEFYSLHNDKIKSYNESSIDFMLDCLSLANIHESSAIESYVEISSHETATKRPELFYFPNDILSGQLEAAPPMPEDVEICPDLSEPELTCGGKLEHAFTYEIGDVVTVQSFDGNGLPIEVTGRLVDFLE